MKESGIYAMFAKEGDLVDDLHDANKRLDDGLDAAMDAVDDIDLTPETGKLSGKIDEAVDGTSDVVDEDLELGVNKINHILQEKHNWVN